MVDLFCGKYGAPLSVNFLEDLLARYRGVCFSPCLTLDLFGFARCLGAQKTRRLLGRCLRTLVPMERVLLGAEYGFHS